MINVFVSLLIAVLICASPAVAKSKSKSVVMEDIADGGIYCDDPIPGLYELAVKRCKGKVSCTIAATMVATKQELIKKKCTGFFVAPVCNGTPKNIESRYDVFATLNVSCK